MKKTLYIIFGGVLGVFVSIFIHAMIEEIILWQAAKTGTELKWTELFGKQACVLPLWLIILLPILGIIFGVFLGNYLFKKEKK
ncbi:MAG: hypothetical protein NT039_02030 [Candidatus Berkelbacteria bacterium]|nr:hypothetical protein [Candidatus Berkelbacteria bacterium]